MHARHTMELGNATKTTLFKVFSKACATQGVIYQR